MGNTERQANIELLRIVAMYMILVYHTICYVLYDYRVESPIVASLMTLLHIGVPLFVLISGYFGIHPSIRGFFKLYAIVVFYNLFFFFIRLATGDLSFSFGAFCKLWFPFSYGDGYWFITVYIMLYLLSPFLNHIIESMGVSKCLLAFGFISVYFGWFAKHPSLIDGKNLVNFSFIYLLGHWIRTITANQSPKHLRTLSLIGYLIVAGLIGVTPFFSDEKMMAFIKRWCFGYNSPILLLMSVLFFLFLSSFDFSPKRKLSQVINWIASSSLAVYLIHENRWFWGDQWYGLIKTQYLTYDGGLFAIILCGECFLLFIVSILIDKVRTLILRM